MKAYHPSSAIRFALLICTAIFTAWFPLMAQEADHVYLKTGSIVRGKIVEIAPEDHVKIEDFSGNLWNFNMSEVERITSEPYQWEQKKVRAESLGFEAGVVNMTSIGFLAGSSLNEQTAPFSLASVTGYRTSSGLFAGIGAGVEFLSRNYVPLFLDLRYDFFGVDVVPYLVVKGGYSLPLDREDQNNDLTSKYSGGPLLGVGAGLKIRTRHHLAWDLSLLYRYMETSYTETYGWNNQEYEYTDIYNRIEIRLGLYID
jgi:hypothetical protein